MTVVEASRECGADSKGIPDLPGEGLGPPIVIVGTGIPGVCATINKLVDIAYNAPDDGPPVPLFVLDTKDQPKPGGSTPYPLDGLSTDAMHPFKTATPPPGFPSFGEYAREIAEADPSWRSAAHAPSYAQVREYLKYMMELAVTAAATKLCLDFRSKPVESIEEAVRNGPATIRFKDGAVVLARQIIRAGKPPHMSGPETPLPSFFPPVDLRVAIPQIVDLIWPPPNEEEHDRQRMIAAFAGDDSRVRAFWELWPFRMAAFLHVLARHFKTRQVERDAIEAEVIRLVEERVNAFEYPGDDRVWWYRNRLARYAKAIDEVPLEEVAVGGVELAAAREFATVMGGDEKFIVPIADEYFWDRCHYMGRLCGGMALDVQP